MRLPISQILTRIASTVNQEATAPTTGGSEYNLWFEYINRAYQEWAESNDWEALRKYFYPSITGDSVATVSLPLDYRKMAAPVLLKNQGTGSWGTQYPDIIEEQRGLQATTDNFVYEVGDISTGMSLVFNPGTLSSGASIEIQYFSMPTSLASPADVPIVGDSQFLIDRTIAYIFESRSDSRFQTMEAKARDRLLGMIENENLSKFSSYNNPNPVINSLRKQGFRLGRD